MDLVPSQGPSPEASLVSALVRVLISLQKFHGLLNSLGHVGVNTGDTPIWKGVELGLEPHPGI